MPTSLAGIQPGYLPWLGYFDQMRRVDAFVIADEMQFSTSGWAHRNRVRGPRGPHWLTVPVRARAGERIGEVALDSGRAWARRHVRTLRHFYRRSPFAAELLSALLPMLERPATRLVEISVPVIRFLAEQFRITTPILLSSDLGLERFYAERFPDQPSATHRIIAFMEAVGARELLEGESGRAYLNLALCETHGIRVRFHRYEHPVYRQLHEPFVSHLSAVDLLLCAGVEQARRVLEGVP